MTLSLTFTDFSNHLTETKQLAADAHVWSTLDWSHITHTTSFNPFTKRHKELVTQVAFFQTFLGWEQFLEESFIKYLLGEHPPKGLPPKCYAIPPNRLTAEKMVAEGRNYPDWTAVSNVIDRADRFFDSGEPYVKALKLKQSTLDEIKTIRNAVAHSSQNSKAKFKHLVRGELGSFPLNLTVGGFLGMTIPKTSSKAKSFVHPTSYFEFYVDTFLWLAKEIVPI